MKSLLSLFSHFVCNKKRFQAAHYVKYTFYAIEKDFLSCPYNTHNVSLLDVCCVNYTSIHPIETFGMHEVFLNSEFP